MLAAVAVAFGLGTFAALMAASGGFGGGDDESDGSLVALAFRLDGGSPALSGFAGDLEENLVGLPAGEYYIEAVTSDDAVLTLGVVEIADGEMLGMAPDTDTEALRDAEHAAAIRTIATFLADVELAKLSVFESLSGGFQAPLLDPSVEPTAEDLEALVARYGEIAGQEASVLEAVATVEDGSDVAHPVSYVQAGGSPAGRLFGSLLDNLLPDFINRIRNVGERERERSLEIVENIDPWQGQEVFEGMPANLRGGAASFEEWREALERGELDDATGAIHGYLYVAATDATQRSGHTPGASLAEEGAPLLRDGVDYALESYGRVPHVSRMIEVTNKTLEWEEYARELYENAGATLDQIESGEFLQTLQDRMEADLREMAPHLTDAVVESLAAQMAARIVAEGPQFVAALTEDEPPADDLAWIDEFVDALADELVANGESGIAVAVATDDLRQCLLGAVDAGLTQNEALERCAAAIVPTPTPAPEPELTGYYAIEALSFSNMTLSVRTVQQVESGELRNCDFLHGGLCEEGDPPAEIRILAGPFETADEAEAWLCERMTDIHPPPLAAGLVADFEGQTVSTEVGC